MTGPDEADRLRAALRDAAEGLEEALPYVPEFFREKWDMDGYLERAHAALAGAAPVKSLEEMQREVVAFCIAKGWRDTSPSFLEAMALLHSEVSEAVEAWREHGTADATKFLALGRGDHGEDLPIANPKPEGVGSELADVFIRLLDDCELFGVDLRVEFERKMGYNLTRSHRHGGKAL